MAVTRPSGLEIAPRRVLCGGGTSSQQPGISPIITLTAAGIDAFLSVLIDPVAATVIAGILAASLQIDAATYCASDPPADPGITPGDVIDAMNFTDTVNQAIAVQKLGTWFLSQYWYSICKCDTGTQPTPPTPSNPGPASQNPGIPGANQPSPCWSQQMPWSLPARATGSNNETYQDLGVQLLPSGPSISYLVDSTVGFSTTAYAIPSGVSNLHLGMTTDQTNSNLTLSIEWAMLNSSGVPHGSGLIAEWQGSAIIQSASVLTLPAPPAGAVYWTIFAQNDNFNAFTGTASASMSCAPGTSLAERACCPPDATSQQMLLQIIGILNSTKTSITTIQNDITTLDTTVNNMNTTVNTLSVDVTNLQTDVTVLQTDVTNLQNTVNNETNTSITEVNTTVTNTDTTVNTINTTVNSISAELTLNTTTVNQLQAVLAPLGYTLGAAHAGLTGEGSFAVSGLSGVVIQLTAIPQYVGFELGEPNYLFDVGWASVLDSNGFIDQTRIHAALQVWQPRIMTEATVIGYSLNPGVVATFTETHPRVG